MLAYGINCVVVVLFFFNRESHLILRDMNGLFHTTETCCSCEVFHSKTCFLLKIISIHRGNLDGTPLEVNVALALRLVSIKAK